VDVDTDERLRSSAFAGLVEELGERQEGLDRDAARVSASKLRRELTIRGRGGAAGWRHAAESTGARVVRQRRRVRPGSA
jgi:hypothetical protein